MNRCVVPPPSVQARATDPGVWPRRWITSSSRSPTTSRSPCASRWSGATGSASASSSPAAERAPVASTTSGSARWWSQCWCVVTTRSRRPSARAVPHHREQRAGGVGGVDEQLRAGGAAGEQVGDVVLLGDRRRPQRRAGQLGDLDLGVGGHRRHPHAGRSGRSPVSPSPRRAPGRPGQQVGRAAGHLGAAAADLVGGAPVGPQRHRRRVPPGQPAHGLAQHPVDQRGVGAVEPVARREVEVVQHDLVGADQRQVVRGRGGSRRGAGP